MSSYGIDFGTTNSVLAVFENGKVRVVELDEPHEAEWAHLGFSAVMPTLYSSDENGNILIGWAVKNPANITSNTVKVEAIKRMFQGDSKININGKEVYAEEIATSILSFMKKQAAAQNAVIKKAVITIPANSKALPRYRTKISAGMSGIQVTSLINEPTAAAIAYAYNMPFDQTIMVVDWGGGTLDVTLLQAENGIFIERASKGIAKNGGIDFDRKIASSILKEMGAIFDEKSSAINAFMIEVEKAKIRLSKVESTQISVPSKGMYTLTRAKVAEWVKELVEQVEGPINQVLSEAKLDSSELDALLLVGGTCNMPVVRDFVKKIVPNVSVPEDINPMTAIAEGAAIASAILNGEAEDKGFFVSTEHALGTFILNVEDPLGPRIFSSIIAKNHKLPAKEKKTYYPATEASTQLKVEIVEGEEGLLENDENVVEYTVNNNDIVVSVDASQPNRGVDVTLEYDADGIIHVSIYSNSTGESKDFTVTTGLDMNPAELAEIAREAKKHAESAQSNATFVEQPTATKSSNLKSLSKEQNELINIIESKIIPFLDEKEASPIVKQIKELQSSTDANVANKNEEMLRELISEHSYLL